MPRRSGRGRRRRSIRLVGYDYRAPAAYFVTICAHDRAHLFGKVAAGVVRLSQLGQVVAQEWEALIVHHSAATLDAWVVMPDHLHGIVLLANPTPPQDIALAAWRGGRRNLGDLPAHDPLPRGPARRSLASIIGSFKSATTRRINFVRGTPGAPVWQRGYYERVITDQRALVRVRRYIEDNPLRWIDRNVR